MIFEFLIACNLPTELDEETVRQSMVNDLSEILDYNQIDFDDSMIQIRHKRIANEVSGDDDTTPEDTVVGFFLELPDGTIDSEKVITDFTEALQDNPFISHVVKFEDPLLRAELAERADEIFYSRNEITPRALPHVSKCLSAQRPFRFTQGRAGSNNTKGATKRRANERIRRESVFPHYFQSIH